MNTAPFVPYRVELEPLTPVHIGSGQTIEPYEYDLAEDPEQCWLVVLDPGAVVAEASPAQRAVFERLCEGNDFPALRRWLRQNADRQRHMRFRILVHENAFGQIRKNLDAPARLGEIHLFTRDPATGRPWLPGSSIKGAIRTALVDAAARQDRRRAEELEQVARTEGNRRQGAVRFEARALGYAKGDGWPDLRRDPFRQLAIADALLPEDACWIDRVQIVGPRGRPPSAAGDIPIYRDLLVPPFDEGTPLAAAEVRWHWAVARRGLPREIEPKVICEACNNFYVPRLEKELKRFVADRDLSRRLLDRAGKMADNECLIRLGRHSHFECVTVGKPFHQPPRRGFGRSRSYAGGQLPLGWMRLAFHRRVPP
ncbi:MAG TPA: type III-A CRISPR-associated RAMP protein Csm5 [Planctomycetes bacterium]|nr:type III-A CRISPR-associated RAMP protein Csm5 [Planctomycetota bacterium]